MTGKYKFEFETEYLCNDNETGFYFHGLTNDGHTIEIGNEWVKTFADLMGEGDPVDWVVYIDNKRQYIGYETYDMTVEELRELLSCSKVGEQFLDTVHTIMEFESTVKVEPFVGGFECEYWMPYISELNVLVDTEEDLSLFQYRLVPHYRKDGMEFDGNDEDKIDEGMKQLVTTLPHVDLQKLTAVCYN